MDTIVFAKACDKLFEALDDIVKSDGAWKEKKKQIQDAAKSTGEWAETAIEEFTEWFASDDQ